MLNQGEKNENYLSSLKCNRNGIAFVFVFHQVAGCCLSACSRDMMAGYFYIGACYESQCDFNRMIISYLEREQEVDINNKVRESK